MAIPPAPVVGPQMPWMLGGTPLAPPSLAPPALLGQLTPAERAAMSVNDPSYWARLGNGPVGQAAPTVASQLAPGGAPVAADATPALATEAAAQLAGGGGGGGLAARLAGSGGPTWLTARLGGEAAPGLGLRSLQAGSLGRAGLYGLGGYLAGKGVEKAVGHREGTLDDALRNAVTGAGVGMGIGSIVPIVGTGAGGLLGGAIGFAHGALTGRGSDEGESKRAYDKQEGKFLDTLNRYAVSDDLRQQFMTQFQLSTDGLKRGEINNIAKQMRAALPQLIAQDHALAQETRSRQTMQAAAQAWMAPMMQDAYQSGSKYANQLSQSMLESAKQISSPAQRAFTEDQARQIPLDFASQQAYAMQMMMSLPGLYGYNTQSGQNGIPQMDFNSIINATPIAQPGGGQATFGQIPQQAQQQSSYG